MAKKGKCQYVDDAAEAEEDHHEEEEEEEEESCSEDSFINDEGISEDEDVPLAAVQLRKRGRLNEYGYDCGQSDELSSKLARVEYQCDVLLKMLTQLNENQHRTVVALQTGFAGLKHFIEKSEFKKDGKQPVQAATTPHEHSVSV